MLTTDQMTYHDLVRKNNDLIGELGLKEDEYRENLKKAVGFMPIFKSLLKETLHRSAPAFLEMYASTLSNASKVVIATTPTLALSDMPPASSRAVVATNKG